MQCFAVNLVIRFLCFGPLLLRLYASQNFSESALNFVKYFDV